MFISHCNVRSLIFPKHFSEDLIVTLDSLYEPDDKDDPKGTGTCGPLDGDNSKAPASQRLQMSSTSSSSPKDRITIP